VTQALPRIFHQAEAHQSAQARARDRDERTANRLP
jgi:hypothetical protein